MEAAAVAFAMGVGVPSVSSIAGAGSAGEGALLLRRTSASNGGAKLAVKLKTGGRSSQRWTVQGVRAQANSQQPLYIGYDPKKTVFPAEACEELGGEFCNVEGIGEEVKPTTETSAAPQRTAGGILASIFSPKAENPDRDYIEYDSPKTVFPGEACDDLGGEFCAPEFQEGVYPETKPKAGN